jgi:hypothetical protein
VGNLNFLTINYLEFLSRRTSDGGKNMTPAVKKPEMYNANKILLNFEREIVGSGYTE